MLTSEKKQEYIQGWKQRNRKQEKQRAKQSKKAYKKAKQAAEYLKSNYNIQEVILFGSLARNKFSKNSDIDLAAAGLDLDVFPDIYWEIREIAFPFEIDLLPLEKANKLVKRRIKREGVKL